MKELDINIEGYNVNGICVGCLNHNRKMSCDAAVPKIFKILADIDFADHTIKVCWECMAAVKSICRFRDQITNAYDILKSYSKTHPFLESSDDLTRYAKTSLSLSKTTLIDEVQLELLYDVVIKSETEDNVDDDDEAKICEDDVLGLSVDEPESLVKNEDDFVPYTIDADFQAADISSDEDIQLSKLKKKKEKLKRGKKVKKKGREKVKDKAIPSTSTMATKNASRKSKEVAEDFKDDLKLDTGDTKTSRKLKNLPENLVELYTMTEEEMWQTRSADLASEEFLKMKYKCEDCIIGFHTEKLMTDHMNGKHKQKSPDCEQCDVCKAYLLTKDNLSAHRQRHLAALRCVRCDLRTALKPRMRAHAAVHMPPRRLHCSTCNEVFDTKSKLVYHRGVCRQEPPQCDCCGKVFANKMTLKYHLKILPQNKDDKPKDTLYIPCKGCSKVFRSKKSYRAHVVIHDGLTYPCQVCGKLFQWKRNLSRHMRNHRERDAGALHECRECNKTFASRDCYNNHMKMSKRHVSPDSLSHQCSYCGKKFATRWCMVDHIDWDHLNRIKYQCNVCFKAFKTAKIMVAHMNNIHEKKFKEVDGEHLCEICGKSYKTVKRLKGHVWAMHTNRSTSRRFKCHLCPATFTWQTSIYKHTKMMHSGKRPAPRHAVVKKPEPYQELVNNRIPYFPLATDVQPGAPELLHSIPH